MATVTLTQLQTDSLLYADQRPGGSTAHVDTTSLTRLINQALREFYDLLVSVRGQEYYLTSTTLSLVNGTAGYTLPATFYELGSVTLEWSASDHEIVRPLASLADRADYTPPATWTRWGQKGYRMRGTQAGVNTLEFYPTPTSAVTARVQYIPTMTELVNGPDAIDVVNGWDKLVSLRVATEMLMLAGLQSQARPLQELLEQQRDRIQEMAANRDANEPGHIRDVNPEGCSYMRRPSRWY